MNDNITTIDYGYAASAEQRNKVLRNTYMLLSLSMLPTVAGAWLGVGLQIGMLGMLLAVVTLLGLIFAIRKTMNSAMGVPVLLAFTFVMGLMLSPLIQRTLGFSNGPQLIMTAFGGTAGVFFAMAGLSSVIKRDLSGMGKWLFVGLIVLIVGSLINLFVQSSAAMLAMSVISIGLFSAFMLYDLKRIVDGGETNYISATLSLYLDIVNVFTNLLQLLGVFGGDD